jgi:hypothetical protein
LDPYKIETNYKSFAYFIILKMSSEMNNEFAYDQSAFYEENGLMKGNKKDRKSHGEIAMKQAEERKKKESLPVELFSKNASQCINHLPEKIKRQLLQPTTLTVVEAIKPRLNIARQNTRHDIAYDEEKIVYDDEEEEEILMQEYQEDVAALEAFEQDPENYHAPNYGDSLRQRIREYEIRFNIKTDR